MNDIFTQDVLSVPPDTPMHQVLASMQQHTFSSIVVVEDRCPLGIFTERDAVMLASRNNNLVDMRVGERMSSPVVTVKADLELHEAYQLMVDHGIRHLVVVDDDELLAGVVSEGDFANHLDPWLLNQLDRVESVMTRNIISGDPQESVAAGIRRMADRHISCIVVGRPDKAEGVLTERDVTQLLLSKNNLEDELLDHVIHRPVHSIRQSESLQLARERMESLGVRRLLVTDASDNWVGLITRHDLLCGLEQNYWRNLHENEALFRSLYEQAPLPYQSLDEKGGLLAVNKAWEESLGYDRKQVIGRNFSDFHAPGQQEEYQKALAGFLDSGTVDVIFDFLCQDGTHKTMSVNGRIAYDAEGHFQRTHCILTDITEKAITERQLRESEQRFREVVENIEDVFWVTDPETSQIIYINPAYERIWGLSTESLYKKPGSFIQGVHPEDRTRFVHEIENLARGIYHDMEYRIVRPDGSERRVRDRAFPVHDANGEVYRVAGIIQDITEIHQANAALKESEARFRSIFEYAAAGMATGTPDGRISEVNPTLANMLGYTQDELAGKTIREITHPDDWEANKKKLEAVNRGEISTYQLQKRYLKKDGATVWIHLSSAWVRDNDGKPLFFVALQQDINQQKNSEALLNEQLSERASLLNAAPVGIGLVQNREFQWLSQRFLDLLGYPENELLGKNSRCVYLSDEEYERVGTEKYAQIKATGLGEIETVMRHKDGHALNILLRSVPLDEGNLNKGTIFTALDITERKHMEQKLISSASELAKTEAMAHLGGWNFDLSTGKETWSDEVFRILGLEPGSVEPDRDMALDSIHPEDRPRIMEKSQLLVEQQQPYDEEFRIIWPDGQIRWVHIQNRLECNEDGEFCFISGVIQDITERKQAEEELRLFRTLVDYTKDALWVADAKSAKIIDFNEEACRSTGYTRDELSHMRIHDITDMFDAAPSAWEEFENRIKHTGDLTFESTVLRKDGTQFPVEVNVRLVSYRGKEYGIAAVRDITESKRSKQTILDKNRELETLLNTIPSPVYFEDHKLRYQMVNRAFLEFLGLAEEQVIGKTDAELFPSANAKEFTEGDLAVIHQNREITDFEQVVTDSSGRLHWFSTSKTPLSNSKGEVVGLVGISTEITQLKQMAEQRLAKEQLLRETLIREVHHRIKNHLQGVVGMLHNLKHTCTDITRCLEKAITQVRAIATVYGLYGQAGKNHLSISELVKACISVYPQEETVKIKYQFDDISEFFLAREESVPVALVINELIANAIKHSSGPVGEHRIDIVLSKQEQKISLCISNSSDGLPNGFDFNNGKALGTGLELLRTLLPPKGTHLDIYPKNNLVIAELILESPVIWIAE